MKIEEDSAAIPFIMYTPEQGFELCTEAVDFLVSVR